MERITGLAASAVSVYTIYQYTQMSSIARRVIPRTRRIVSSRAMASISRGQLSISSAFDSGNIRVLDASDSKNVQLEIREDPFTHGTDKRNHFQWFYFRVSNAKGIKCRYRLTNAHKASYPAAWPGYQVAYSYNPSATNPVWLRVSDTTYDKPDAKATNDELIWNFQSDRDTVWFAYFAPFSYERHQSLISSMAASPLASTRVIGHSLAGRPIDLVTLGAGDRKVWVIARQHPGEHMAEWWMQGFLARLARDDKSDSAIQTLLKDATVYVVPNMCPDGAVQGHLRTNKAGANLNREWQGGVYEGYSAPSAERSPEVLSVLEEMKKTGVDLFIDVHGDEEIPDNFFAGSQGIPSWSKRQEQLYLLLNAAVLRHSKDFQVGRGYGKGGPDYLVENSKKGQANLSVASNHVGNRFNCCAATLEMPFKDTTVSPDKKQGWSSSRCEKFGSDMAGSFAELLPFLRGEALGNTEGKAAVAKAIEETKGSGEAWYKESA